MQSSTQLWGPRPRDSCPLRQHSIQSTECSMCTGPCIALQSHICLHHLVLRLMLLRGHDCKGSGLLHDSGLAEPIENESSVVTTPHEHQRPVALVAKYDSDQSCMVMQAESVHRLLLTRQGKAAVLRPKWAQPLLCHLHSPSYQRCPAGRLAVEDLLGAVCYPASQLTSLWPT